MSLHSRERSSLLEKQGTRGPDADDTSSLHTDAPTREEDRSEAREEEQFHEFNMFREKASLE